MENANKQKSENGSNEELKVDINKVHDKINVDINSSDEDIDIEVKKDDDNIDIKIITDDEIIDIEIHSKTCKEVPKGKKYRIKIDREYYVVDQECMLGSDILLKAGKDPKEFQLRQKFNNGSVITIPNNQKVCFTEPGIEKFKTLPLDQTEGETNEIKSEVPRRDFTLLEEDENYLNTLKLKWESIVSQGGHWVLIHNYPLPKGFNVTHAILAVRISPGYPTAQLDMLYFYPSITRLDGQSMNALTPFTLDGKTFQQWSRHRTARNPWRPDIDNLSTHIPLAEVWFSQEFQKRPYHAISA